MNDQNQEGDQELKVVDENTPLHMLPPFGNFGHIYPWWRCSVITEKRGNFATSL